MEFTRINLPWTVVAMLLVAPALAHGNDMVTKKQGDLHGRQMTQAAMNGGETQMKGMKNGRGTGMSMPMGDTPAHFAPTREAYTDNHVYLVKLVGLPHPIPYQRHFTLKFAVFDGRNPGSKALGDATLSLHAGMRHGMTKGFAHGMNSTPRVKMEKGEIAVRGMYFHMMGKWTVKVTVSRGGRRGTAYFDLPCCGT